MIEFPIDVEVRPRGEESQEKITQEQREQTALGALYMSSAHIPDCPSEPSNIIPEEDVDKDVVTMTSGPEADAVFWNSEMPASPIAPPSSIVPNLSSVADLIAQLTGNPQQGGGQSLNGQGVDLNVGGVDANAALATMQSLPPEQLQQLLSQLAPTAFGQAAQTAYSADQQGWPNQQNQYNDFAQGYDDADRGGWFGGESRGRGSRGRGRGRGGRSEEGGYRHNKKRPCNFFQAGRRALNLLNDE